MNADGCVAATRQHSLSVVVPVCNGEGWIGRCLTHVVTGLDRSGLGAVEVIVVDDGSTDGTGAEATGVMRAASHVPFRLESGPNAGRFAARRRGLDLAQHEYVLFVDTRVFLGPDALSFVGSLLHEPGRQVWTSHVVAATKGNRLAGFWQAIEHVAWRRYFADPRTTSFGIDEFDYFPKGTTALLAPRAVLVEAFDAFTPTVGDWRKVNDDTAVLRWVAERMPINVSPGYASTYHARADLVSFLRHAEHRGTVLIDGYLRRGTRFAVPISVVLAVSPFAVAWALRHPVRALVAALGGSVAAGVAAGRLGARRDDATVLGVLAAPFGTAYLAGMWHGTWLRARWWTDRRG